MRGLFLWCLLTAAAMLARPATATSDGGLDGFLLAVGGTDQRFAVVQYRSVQEGCFGGCETFIVDTQARAFRRLHVARVKQEEGDMTGAYLAQLPQAMRDRLTPIASADSLPRLTFDPDKSQENDMAFIDGARTLRVKLEQLWTAPSMKTFDDEGQTCIDMSSGEALCSGCRRVIRWLDGEKRETWSCRPGRFPEAMVWEEGDRQCDCSARATMNALTANWTGRGPKRRGSKVLVEPFALQQHTMTGGSTEVTLAGSFGDAQPTSTAIEAVVLKDAIVVLGAVVHARFANGTFLPVVVALPR